MDIIDIVGMTLVKFPRFKEIIKDKRIVEDMMCNTAYTDGKRIGYNSNFLNGLSEDENVFVLAHEILHIMYKHIERLKGRDPKIWNYVTDAIINQTLIKAGLKPPEGVILVEGADDYRAEELYDLLITDSPKLPSQIKEAYKNMSEKQAKHLEDTHGAWESEKSQDSQGDGEDFKNIDERNFFKENEEARRKMRNDFSKKNAQKSFLGIAAGEAIRVDDIGKPTQLINWKTMVRTSLRKRKKKPDGTYEIKDGIVSERTKRQKEKSLMDSQILLDTSGSVDGRMLRGFLKECKSILKDSKIKVGCFDANFYGFQSVNNNEDIENLQLNGGGGTDLILAASSFTEGAKSKIIFTDGYGDEPQKAEGVIWIIYGNKNFKVPAGSKAVFVDPKELDDMRASGGMRYSFLRE